MTLRIGPILYVVFLVDFMNHGTFSFKSCLEVLRCQSTVMVNLKRGLTMHPQLLLTLDHIIVKKIHFFDLHNWIFVLD